jgi:hypothetical protein
MMTPAGIIYLVLPILYVIYASLTLAIHFWYFAPVIDSHRPPLRKLFQIALYDRSSELNKRSSMLGAFLSLSTQTFKLLRLIKCSHHDT